MLIVPGSDALGHHKHFHNGNIGGQEPAVFVPACKLGGVIETTGAGDTFCASVLNFVLEHGIQGLTVEERREMLRFANTAAYIVTTRKGAIRAMPTREEVLALL